MLTIFADNTMILDTVNDRQDAHVVTTSPNLRGLERLAARLMRAVVPVGVYPIGTVCSAESCRRSNSGRHWQLLFGQLGLSGLKQLPGTGQPVGPGRLMAG